MARLLLIAFEGHEAGQIAGFAQALGLPFDILAVTSETAMDTGAEKIYRAALEEVPPADGLAKAIAAIATPYSHIAGASSMRGKDVLARLAGVLNAATV